MRERKTDMIYGRMRGLIRDQLRRRKTVSAYNLPIPRKQATANLDGMVRFGELVKIRPATLGRNAKPAVYARSHPRNTRG